MNVENLSLRDVVWMAAMGLGFVGLSGGAWWGMTRQDLWLCNGLPESVHVQLDNETPQLVPAGSKTAVNLRVGAHTVKVHTVKGKQLAQDQLMIPAHYDVVAYNVAGAMPLYAAAILYKPSYAADEALPPPVFFGGQRFIAHDHLDYVFTQPPESISVKGGASHLKWMFDALPGDWQRSMWQARSRGDERSVIDLCQAVAELRPEDEAAQDCIVMQTATVQGYEAGRKAAERAVQRLPRSVSLHRSYQAIMRMLDRTDELRARYRALHEQDPQDGVLTALYARTLAPDAALPLFQEALASADELPTRHALARVLQWKGRYKESLEQYEHLAKTDPDYGLFLESHARVLLALGRTDDALALARDRAKDPKKGDWRAAVLVAEVVRVGGFKDVDGRYFVQSLGRKDADLAAYMQSYLGEEPDHGLHVSPDVQKVTSVQAAAARDPGAAWSACQGVAPGMLRQLDPATAVLLAAEFERVGDPVTAAPLWRQAAWLLTVPLSALRRYVQDGTVHPELWRLDVDERAALDLVRARALETAGGDAASLYRDLAGRTVLSDIIARAIAGWPHPADNAKVVMLRPDRADRGDGSSVPR